MTAEREEIWSCKIGGAVPRSMPSGWDFPMRRAVEAAWIALTGLEPQFTFSGRGQLDEDERAYIEKRLPCAAPAPEVAKAIGRISEVLAGLVDESEWPEVEAMLSTVCAALAQVQQVAPSDAGAVAKAKAIEVGEICVALRLADLMLIRTEHGLAVVPAVTGEAQSAPTQLADDKRKP
jgi:hypothetical protein